MIGAPTAHGLGSSITRARLVPDPVSGHVLRVLAVLVYVMCAAFALLR